DNQGSLRQGMPEVTPVEIRAAVAHSAQEPTEATQGRLNAAPERRRNLRPSGRGGCQHTQGESLNAEATGRKSIAQLDRLAQSAPEQDPDPFAGRGLAGPQAEWRAHRRMPRPEHRRSGRCRHRPRPRAGCRVDGVSESPKSTIQYGP